MRILLSPLFIRVVVFVGVHLLFIEIAITLGNIK